MSCTERNTTSRGRGTSWLTHNPVVRKQLENTKQIQQPQVRNQLDNTQSSGTGQAGKHKQIQQPEMVERPLLKGSLAKTSEYPSTARERNGILARLVWFQLYNTEQTQHPEVRHQLENTKQIQQPENQLENKLLQKPVVRDQLENSNKYNNHSGTKQAGKHKGNTTTKGTEQAGQNNPLGRIKLEDTKQIKQLHWNGTGWRTQRKKKTTSDTKLAEKRNANTTARGTEPPFKHIIQWNGTSWETQTNTKTRGTDPAGSALCSGTEPDGEHKANTTKNSGTVRAEKKYKANTITRSTDSGGQHAIQRHGTSWKTASQYKTQWYGTSEITKLLAYRTSWKTNTATRATEAAG
ncbi:hypothetical protein CHS0354_024974 [Potamilus streckersoni]|uniref:Uncharacterized protein n=1 Tax=Potamilus streckersoni TaxID=2493646 RepID=A0AAE0T2K2_9BIVA|nr:hypothetical protein CHS0354_024974 [Potamilus streckersoni]